jgi:hypothetical protein
VEETVLPGIKTCFCCKVEKSTTEFYKSPSAKCGLSSYCKPCHFISVKSKGEGRACSLVKTCVECREPKSYLEFYRRSKGRYLMSICKECSAIHSRDYHANNQAKVQARWLEWSAVHRPPKHERGKPRPSKPLPSSKVCVRCQIEKPAADFPQKVQNGRTFLRATCKPCCITILQDWQAHNPDKVRKGWWIRQLRQYGVTEDWFESMLASQGGGARFAVPISPEAINSADSQSTTTT